jgi:hypothetical protein
VSEQPTEKVALIECVVGSKNWVYTVQEYILDNHMLCFVCGEEITYKLDFFYMRGRMGTIMLHDSCFTPWTRRSAPTAAERVREQQEISKMLADDSDWMDCHEAARIAGVSYAAIYQRVFSGSLVAEKRYGKWFVSRKSLATWGERRHPQGRRPAASRPTIPKKPADAPKARIWRSEVTEPIERITAHNAALKIGVSRSWILQRKERFDAVKISGAWMLSKKLVEDYIRDEEQGELEPVG